MNREGEMEMVQLQGTKGTSKFPEATRKKQGRLLSQSLQGGHCPSDPLISCFQTPELGIKVLLLLHMSISNYSRTRG